MQPFSNIDCTETLSDTKRRTVRDISDSNDKWRIAKKDGHGVDDVTLVSLHLYKLNVCVPELAIAW